MTMDDKSLEETIRLLGWHIANLKQTSLNPAPAPKQPKLKLTNPNKYLIIELRGILRSYHGALERTKAENAKLSSAVDALEIKTQIPEICEEEISDHDERVRRVFLARLRSIQN